MLWVRVRQQGRGPIVLTRTEYNNAVVHLQSFQQGVRKHTAKWAFGFDLSVLPRSHVRWHHQNVVIRFPEWPSKTGEKCNCDLRSESKSLATSFYPEGGATESSQKDEGMAHQDERECMAVYVDVGVGFTDVHFCRGTPASKEFKLGGM